MSKRAQTPRGFTLIELMIVMATIGLLASVALPSYQSMVFRSKQAERSIMMSSIHRAIDEYFARESRYPLDMGGGQTWLYLIWDNPDATPTTQKRPWRVRPLNNLDNWNNLSLIVEGGVYYSYYGYAYDMPGTHVTYLQARGDLDGDKVINQLVFEWYTWNNRPQWAGMRDARCPSCYWVSETNPNSY